MNDTRKNYIYKLTISYDGQEFCGWQIQPRQRTVQGVVQAALDKLLRRKTKLEGASRTDAGVHPLGQSASFSCERPLINKWLKTRLNKLLPHDVVVRSARRMPAGFHSRYAAKGKRYRYQVSWGERSPFERGYYLHIPRKPDLKALQRGLAYFKGKHDFSSFCATGGGAGSADDKVRRIDKAWLSCRGGSASIYFEGDAFVYKQVRNMVGALLDVGRGRLAPHAIKTILEARDRRKAPGTAAAAGLYLVKVYY